MLKSTKERDRIGSALALGSLPKAFLQDKLSHVLSALFKCTRCSDGDREWAECRRDVFNSIQRYSRIIYL